MTDVPAPVGRAPDWARADRARAAAPDPAAPGAVLDRRDARTRPDATAFASARTALAARLRRACAEVPAAQFEGLVLDIVRMRLRWAQRGWRP